MKETSELRQFVHQWAKRSIRTRAQSDTNQPFAAWVDQTRSRNPPLTMNSRSRWNPNSYHPPLEPPPHPPRNFLETNSHLLTHRETRTGTSYAQSQAYYGTISPGPIAAVTSSNGARMKRIGQVHQTTPPPLTAPPLPPQGTPLVRCQHADSPLRR